MGRQRARRGARVEEGAAEQSLGHRSHTGGLSPRARTLSRAARKPRRPRRAGFGVAGARRRGSPGTEISWRPRRSRESGRRLGDRGDKAEGQGERGQPYLTAVQRRLAEPAVQVSGLAAGLPQRQVVLVVRRHPGGAQHGPQVQAQRQEDAHQPHQLQRGQHRDAHLLHAAAGRSHRDQGEGGGGR